MNCKEITQEKQTWIAWATCRLELETLFNSNLGKAVKSSVESNSILNHGEDAEAANLLRLGATRLGKAALRGHQNPDKASYLEKPSTFRTTCTPVHQLWGVLLMCQEGGPAGYPILETIMKAPLPSAVFVRAALSPFFLTHGCQVRRVATGKAVPASSPMLDSPAGPVKPRGSISQAYNNKCWGVKYPLSPLRQAQL